LAVGYLLLHKVLKFRVSLTLRSRLDNVESLSRLLDAHLPCTKARPVYDWEISIANGSTIHLRSRLEGHQQT